MLTPASAIVMRPVRWLWSDRVPAGAITLVPGREGIGKSLMLAWLTAHITRGTLPGQYEGSRRSVVYAASEDSWAHTIAPRLYAAGADLNMVYRVEVERDGATTQLTLPRDCGSLAVEIERQGVALLAADPLLSLISAGIDNHRDRDLRTALEPLAQLADTTGCAVVGLAHFNKSASVDALNLITGSRAFSAVARAVLAVARDNEADDGSCVLSQAKNNLGRLDVASMRYAIDSAAVPTVEGAAQVGVLRFTGESDRSVADILSIAGEHESRGERDHVAQWLHEQLAANGGEAQWSKLRKAAREDGIAERTLQRVRHRVGIVVERTGFGTGSVWRLPVEPDDASHAPSTSPTIAPHSRHSRHDSTAGANGANGNPSSLHVVHQPSAGEAS